MSCYERECPKCKALEALPEGTISKTSWDGEKWSYWWDGRDGFDGDPGSRANKAVWLSAEMSHGSNSPHGPNSARVLERGLELLKNLPTTPRLVKAGFGVLKGHERRAQP